MKNEISKYMYVLKFMKVIFEFMKDFHLILDFDSWLELLVIIYACNFT